MTMMIAIIQELEEDELEKQRQERRDDFDRRSGYAFFLFWHHSLLSSEFPFLNMNFVIELLPMSDFWESEDDMKD